MSMRVESKVGLISLIVALGLTAAIAMSGIFLPFAVPIFIFLWVVLNRVGEAIARCAGFLRPQYREEEPRETMADIPPLQRYQQVSQPPAYMPADASINAGIFARPESIIAEGELPPAYTSLKSNPSNQ